MSEVEQAAQEQFKATFRNRLCEMLSEIEEEYKSAFMQGYAKCETDEKFKIKQITTDIKKQAENYAEKYAEHDNGLRTNEFSNLYHAYVTGATETTTKLKAQLDKAKEIIETFISFSEAFGYRYSFMNSFIDTAADFINKSISHTEVKDDKRPENY